MTSCLNLLAHCAVCVFTVSSYLLAGINKCQCGCSLSGQRMLSWQVGFCRDFRKPEKSTEFRVLWVVSEPVSENGGPGECDPV